MPGAVLIQRRLHRDVVSVFAIAAGGQQRDPCKRLNHRYRSAVQITDFDISVIAVIAEAFQPLSGRQGEAGIIHIIDHEGIEPETRFQGTYIAKDTAAGLGCQEECVLKGQRPVGFRFIEFL